MKASKTLLAAKRPKKDSKRVNPNIPLDDGFTLFLWFNGKRHGRLYGAITGTINSE